MSGYHRIGGDAKKRKIARRKFDVNFAPLQRAIDAKIKERGLEMRFNGMGKNKPI